LAITFSNIFFQLAFLDHQLYLTYKFSHFQLGLKFTINYHSLKSLLGGDKKTVYSTEKVKLSCLYKPCSEHKAPCNICLSTTMRSVASFTIPSPYPCRKSSLYELDKRLEGHQNQLRHGGKRKTESLNPACNQFTLLFELLQLFTKHMQTILSL
jgi:hypothetical protein